MTSKAFRENAILLEGGVTYQPRTKTFDLKFAMNRPPSRLVISALGDNAIVEVLCLDRYHHDGSVSVTVPYDADEAALGDLFGKAIDLAVESSRDLQKAQ